MKPQFMKGITWTETVIRITNTHVNKIFLTNFLSERTFFLILGERLNDMLLS